jgi:mono/diheme cytochrome c family protein
MLLSCGGRATDGLEPEVSEPGASRVSDDEPTAFGPVRETCDDNPLLAGCPSVNVGGTPLSPPEAPGPAPVYEPQFISLARNVLSANCGACHGATLTEAQASAAINYIDDWGQLIEAGLIDECSPESSRIIEVMRTGEMPPASWEFSVSDADIDTVAGAIELACRYGY